MKIRILGCGPSAGVPMIGNEWGNCDPKEPHNRRTRSSLLVETGTTRLLFDTPPDLREQLLAANTDELSAVLYTHAHADHVMGIDDLKLVNWKMQKAIPVYGDKFAIEEIVRRFSYIFEKPWSLRRYRNPGLVPHVVEREPIVIDSVTIEPFKQEHGKSQSLGYRIGDFAYSTDVSGLDDAAFKTLEGVKLWVVGCAAEEAYAGHAGLQTVLEWIDRVKPERAFLTHMDHTMDYETLLGKLPTGVLPAYDGLEIEC